MSKRAVGVLEVGLTISIIISIRWACCAAFTPVDNYLVDCGSLSGTTIGDRTFAADSSLPSRLTTPTDILANTTLDPQSSSGMSAIYKTARIFTGSSSYSFSIKLQGRHLVRLHFFPFAYGDYNLTNATFSVSTQDVLLLNNFRPPVRTSMKEYSLMVARDNLILSFAPSGISSVAFVNAIEVISIVDDRLTESPWTVRGTPWIDVSGQALETVYRLNVGGQEVLPDSDPFGRIWEPDAQFLSNGSRSKTFSFLGQIYYLAGGPTKLTAPEIVYSTVRELNPSNTSDTLINMTWKLSVDANFSYLMRFHFCDVVGISGTSGVMFNVRVGEWTVLENFEPASETYQMLATAYSIDFVLDANDASNELLISISPSSLNVTYDGQLIPPNGILNGLEVMKMNFSAGSLFVVTPSGSKKSFSIKLGSGIGSVAIVIVVLFLALKQYSGTWTPFCSDHLHHKRSTQSQMEAAEPDESAQGIRQSAVQNDTAFNSEKNRSYFDYSFSLVVLQEATNCFDEGCLIGNGGFGKVYEGMLGDGTKVAVKRGDSKLRQGLNEFHNEIELLSRIRHRHLVSFVGYCDEENEMILVYEYMEMGTLKRHLYGSNLPPLTWKQRLEICIGSARGLHYLHTSLARPIIHRDVKSANILLDENLTAKISDFGVSRIGPEMVDKTHISTVVKGSFGYIDPEYFRMQRLTQKSDVYSFGVVLLEVISARPVISPTLSGELVGLAEWGKEWLIKGEMEQIVDPRIAGTIKPASLQKFAETMMRCLADHGVERPSMADVLWNLEYALRLHGFDSGISEIYSLDIIPQLGQIS